MRHMYETGTQINDDVCSMQLLNCNFAFWMDTYICNSQRFADTNNDQPTHFRFELC